jgi:hypothetical protein
MMSKYLIGGMRLVVLGVFGAILVIAGGQGISGKSNSTVSAAVHNPQDKSEVYTRIPISRPQELHPIQDKRQGQRPVPHVAVSDAAKGQQVHLSNELVEIRRQIGSAVAEVLGDEFKGEQTEEVFREELLRIASNPAQDQLPSLQPQPWGPSLPPPPSPQPPTANWNPAHPHLPYVPQYPPFIPTPPGYSGPQGELLPPSFPNNQTPHSQHFNVPDTFRTAARNFGGPQQWQNSAPNLEENRPQNSQPTRICEVKKLRDFARRIDDMANDLEENSLFELADQMREQAQRCRVLAREKSNEASPKNDE